ncbi:DNA polymerase Y family protein [Fodinicola acaciae]|uniref:DNA polymerase Y family protein n=1 Tax=Fodinicola acaciae TaxID=2681555 RepID=UPI0013D7E5C1|nr:DNA polymerase Y family protein [Fodinicola acaciae]
MAVRTLVLWCPDWPVIAAMAADGVPTHQPAAVLVGNRVVACSAPARVDGVRRGLRRREAQARCPELAVLAADPERDAREFEPIVRAAEELAPGVEVVRPGLVSVAARGPSGYYGGDQVAAQRLVEQVAAETGVEAQAGIADGLFAATLAARRGLVVEPGESAGFLAPLDIGELAVGWDAGPAGRQAAARSHRAVAESLEEYVQLFRRLGLRTLGGFAALPASDVASRFGVEGERMHRLARGVDPYPPAARRPPADLTVTLEPEDPIERVDVAAFVARQLAGRFHRVLAAHGVACTRLVIEAHTEHGEQLSRTWRHDGVLTVGDVADRVRWQLDGWLTAVARGGAVDTPTAGISMLRLVPDEVVDHSGLQAGLWGDVGERDERAHRALTHVQGMLGPEAVLTPVLGGGRGPADRVRLVPWRDDREPALPAEPPWPGRLPSPSPTVLPAEPMPAAVRDAAGKPVTLSGRHELSAPPHWVTIGDRPPRGVLAWAGPWPVDERWWDQVTANRRARFQIVLADDTARRDRLAATAFLLSLENSTWTVEGIYD